VTVLVGRTGLSPVMVGRGSDLAQLAGLLDTPGKATALVGGEAGMGKTRLVRELVDHLPDDVLVLAGQADPGALGRPFELLLDAVSEHLPNDDPRLAGLRRSGDDQAPVAERLRVALALVVEVVDGRRSVVIFEDLHWADSESVALFEQLSRPELGPDVLIGTYRPSEISRRHPLAEAIPRLERLSAVVHLHLERLGPTEVQDFLGAVYGGVPPYRVAETLHARTGGNPFFLEELLVAAGSTGIEDLCSLPLPWNVAEVVRGQVDELPAAERAVVETAAVLGRRVSFDVLAAVTGTSEEELIAVLRSLIAHGLLVETDPDTFGFRHDLSREAIEGRLLGRERRRLHDAALDALRRSGRGDLAAMARHAHGAGRYDDVIDLARQGTAHYLAIGSSYQALSLAELGLSEAEDDQDLRAGAARAAWLSGLLDDAVDHALRLERDAEATGHRERRSEARRLLARLYWERGDDAARLVVVDALTRDLEILGDGPEQARVLGVLAQEAMLVGRVEDACEWADRAVAAADRHHLPDVRLAALVEKGSALLNQKVDVPETIAMLLAVADDAVRAGEDVSASRAWHNVAFSSWGHLSPAERLALFDRMRAAASRAGWDHQAVVPFAEGHFDVAVEVADMAEAQRWYDEYRRVDVGLLAPTGWMPLRWVWLLLELGKYDEAAAALAAVGAVPSEQAEYRAALEVATGVANGHLAEARRHLHGLVVKAGETGVDGVSVGLLIPYVLDHGLDAADLQPVVDGIARWGGSPSGPVGPGRRRFDAHLALAAGRVEEAIDGFAVVAALRRVDLPLEAPDRAVDHLGAARALLLAQRRDEAVAHADEANRLLEAWTGWRRRALATLDRRLGRGDEDVAGPPELTPREREVLALVADGLTNAELAERLYISPRTAGVHVSNILAKLGLSSRTEAAAWAIRSGRAVP